ncbi:MAG: diaminopimelate decarboxylase [Clostridiales bacterium]|nr:diaminopimelate decarboxylase [Clostridiales bacterium]
MLISENLNVNEKGNLEIGNVDTIDLVKEHKTPLYVMDEDVIRKNCRSFKASIEKFYGDGLVCYASKTFCCKEMCRIINDEGLGLDISSGGELYTAMSVDFPADKLVFHGNNKTDEELKLALDYGVGRIVVDNFDELSLLNRLAKNLNKTANIMLRIKPGVDSDTHNYIMTGQIDSKFGLGLETGEAFNAAKMAIESDNINLRGFHCHIGSQIFDIEPFALAAKVMLDFIAKVKKELNYEIYDLNLGGGFGIRYTPEQVQQPNEAYMERVSAVVKERCRQLKMRLPFILLEPGRSIAGPAGITLYTVGSVKEIPDVRTYVSVDGGMTDNPRYALYGAKYDMWVANKAKYPKNKEVTIAGKCCESGDLLGEDVKLQDVETGDILAVLATGAYNYSMASNYNRIPRAAVVMVSGGETRVIVKRESYDDLIRNDI